MEFRSLPAQKSLSEKRESKSTSRLKTSELNIQTKIYTSTSTERISSKSRCRSRRPQTCANSRHYSRREFVFFYLLLFASKSGFRPKRYAKIKERFYSRGNKKEKGTPVFSCSTTTIQERLFDFFFQTNTSFSLSLSLSVCVCVIHQCRKPQQIAAAGAAAIMLFNSAPAQAEIMGLTLQNGVPNAAAQKFVQPLVPDGRPVVYVEKDGSADITTFDGRLAANVARSNVGCKTITGAPCVDFASGASK